MGSGVVINVPLGQFLEYDKVTKADLERAELKVLFQIAGHKSYPLCLTRQHFQNYLHLIGARHGAEIGVWTGEFSAHLLRHWNGHLLLVDAWQKQGESYVDKANVGQEAHEANYLATVAAVKPFAGRYEIIRAWSVEAAKRVEDDSLDFVYIDADHSYEAVTADLQAWTPKIRPGGLVAGHDFVDYDGELGHFRVRQAVTDFAGDRPVFCSEEWWPSLWYFVR